MFVLFVILNLKFKEKITKIDILCITSYMVHVFHYLKFNCVCGVYV